MKLSIILPLCLIFTPIVHRDVSFLPYLNIKCLLLGVLSETNLTFDACKKNEGLSVGYARSMEAALHATTFLLISADSGLKFTFRTVTITY